jgi:UDP-N-acetylglucosamine 2-epimerase (non-hydrolysing)
LVGVNREKIISGLVDLLTHPEERQKMAQARNPYGDGQSARHIVDILTNSLAAAKDDPSQV